MFTLLFGIIWFFMFVWALTDILGAKKETSWKMIWIFLCLIFPIGGVVGYYFMGSKKAKEAAITKPQ